MNESDKPLDLLKVGRSASSGAAAVCGTSMSDDQLTGASNDQAAALLAAIVASSSDAIISKTLSSTVTSWNEAAERLFGYTAREMIGRSIRCIVPADRQDEEDRIVAHVSAGHVMSSFETIRVHKNGEPIHVSVTASPVRNAAGLIVGASKILRDITERKRAQESARLLMAEVNHRAKNMLAVVNAIARQTAKANPDDFLPHFTARVQALSASQDLLVRNDWRSMDFADLVRSQLAHFDDLIGSRICLYGPTLRISSDAAQTIGMAFYELATNSGKYGALSTPTGKVEICWHIEGCEFRLSWVEIDGPPVAPPTRRGFGRTVIESMTRVGTGGSAELAFAPTGVTWLLKCPAANVIER